eukprot:CAMPEP_0115091008 /NCGR_PEP_ID=MMETSP0227-20121206/25817_1 /TAXON_ID=89957 /ORGANISM="Polarella glacialis, Strain CCMP 1383" /LENGTH=241 /DNA_ID=CAMNT_0002482359 /DNA_START=82 /DNA_END=807 /DNA_ORIENTATION=+
MAPSSSSAAYVDHDEELHRYADPRQREMPELVMDKDTIAEVQASWLLFCDTIAEVQASWLLFCAEDAVFHKLESVGSDFANILFPHKQSKKKGGLSMDSNTGQAQTDRHLAAIMRATGGSGPSCGAQELSGGMMQMFAGDGQFSGEGVAAIIAKLQASAAAESVRLPSAAPKSSRSSIRTDPVPKSRSQSRARKPAETGKDAKSWSGKASTASSASTAAPSSAEPRVERAPASDELRFVSL